jgi:hypothetical protein
VDDGFERALSAELRRETPFLEAPEDRWQRVRMLARRRRRRAVTAAGAVMLSLGVLAISAVQLSGFGDGSRQTSVYPGAASVFRTPGNPLPIQTLISVNGLTMLVPGSWVAETVSDGSGTPFGLVSAQPLRETAGRCTGGFESCLLRDGKLEPGSFLLLAQHMAQLSPVTAVDGLLPVEPDAPCRSAGGTAADKAVLADGETTYGVEICENRPAMTTMTLIGKALVSADPPLVTASPTVDGTPPPTP